MCRNVNLEQTRIQHEIRSSGFTIFFAVAVYAAPAESEDSGDKGQQRGAEYSGVECPDSGESDGVEDKNTEFELGSSGCSAPSGNDEDEGGE